MGKHILRAAVFLALAAAFLFTTVGLAAEAPEYSDAARAAVPTISVETEKIEQGGLLSVRVTLGAGSVAARAQVEAEGLQFLYTNGGLSTQNGLALLPEAPTVVYHYKVIAQPAQRVSFTLTDTAVLLSADGEEEAAPPVHWSGTVTGRPSTQPTATVYPGETPAPTVRPQGPLIIQGAAGISVSGDLEQSRTLSVTISTTADGMQGTLTTKGLEFVEVNNTFCDASSVILVGNNGTSSLISSATYTFLVKAGPGEEVSIDVTNITLSVNGSDVPGSSSTWINWVPTGAEPAPSAIATQTVDPGSHAFTVSGGLTLQRLQSGRTVIAGLTATRDGRTVQDFLLCVQAPAGGTVQIVNPVGTVLSGSRLITSGCELRVLNAAGEVIDQAVIGIRGDVRDSGTADVAQVVQVAQFVNGNRTPTELQLFCADMNSNGRMDITDLVSVANLIH